MNLTLRRALIALITALSFLGLTASTSLASVGQPEPIPPSPTIGQFVVSDVPRVHAVAYGDQEICLSSASTPSNHPIKIYNEANPDVGYKYLDRGECKWIYDGNWLARVSIPWYDRYWIGQEGEGYGPCHNGSNLDSNPPSIWPNGQYVKYKTSDNNDPC
jgi:hypothetical protein